MKGKSFSLTSVSPTFPDWKSVNNWGLIIPVFAIESVFGWSWSHFCEIQSYLRLIWVRQLSSKVKPTVLRSFSLILARRQTLSGRFSSQGRGDLNLHKANGNQMQGHLVLSRTTVLKSCLFRSNRIYSETIADENPVFIPVRVILWSFL